MFVLVGFAEQNILFMCYMSFGNIIDNGIFGLFYGILLSYMDGILLICMFVVLIIVFN